MSDYIIVGESTGRFGSIGFRLLLVAAFGFLLDYFWTDTLTLHDSPDLVQYGIMAIGVIGISALAYSGFIRFIKNSPSGAWYVGVPVGILFFVALAELYFGIFPMRTTTETIGQSVQQSFIDGYPQLAFDYLFAWLLASIVSGILKLRGTGRPIFA